MSLSDDMFVDYEHEQPRVFTPYKIRIVQTGPEDYEVQVLKFNSSTRWEKYGHTVHILQIAEGIAERLCNPFQPKVIKEYGE
jgi:hypothetical protein